MLKANLRQVIQYPLTAAFKLTTSIKQKIKDHRELSAQCSEIAATLKESMDRAEILATVKELRKQADILEAIVK